MKEKSKAGNVLLVIFGSFLLIWLLYTSVSDLTNKEDVKTITLSEACTLMEMRHMLNGIIPIGSEYYYIAIEKDTNNAYILKASKHWLKGKFDDDYCSIDPQGVEITALCKRIYSSKTRSGISKRINLVEDVNFPYGTENCLYIQYKTTAILRLVLFFLTIFLIVFGIFFVKKRGEVSKYLGGIFSILVLVWCVMLIGVIR